MEGSEELSDIVNDESGGKEAEMREETRYDLLVIGGGPGGYPAALEAARLGYKTGLIEAGELGGTCLNRGCIPTKALLHTVGLRQVLSHGMEIGLRCREVEVDRAALRNRKQEVVETLRKGIRSQLEKHGVALYHGSGRIINPGTVQVEADSGVISLEAEKILVATGSAPAKLPIPGADLPGVLSSDELLELPDEIKEQLVIIGGGVIGMEFAAIYQGLGCSVTILEAAERILPGMDREISQSLKMLMKKRGVSIHTGIRVSKIQRIDGKLCVSYEEKEETRTIETDGVLIAAGRRVSIEGVFAEGCRPRMDKNQIRVDEKFQTSLPGVYAVGDVIGGYQLAHAATAEGLSAVRMMFDRSPGYRLSIIPSCVYVEPEIACVGITAEEAKKCGIPVRTVKYLMGANGKSVLTMQERGFIKVVAEEKTGKILGAQLMCARATDLISQFVQAITAEIPVEKLAETVYPHPTFSEGIGEIWQELNR